MTLTISIINMCFRWCGPTVSNRFLGPISTFAEEHLPVLEEIIERRQNGIASLNNSNYNKILLFNRQFTEPKGYVANHNNYAQSLN